MSSVDGARAHVVSSYPGKTIQWFDFLYIGPRELHCYVGKLESFRSRWRTKALNDLAARIKQPPFLWVFGYEKLWSFKRDPNCQNYSRGSQISIFSPRVRAVLACLPGSIA